MSSRIALAAIAAALVCLAGPRAASAADYLNFKGGWPLSFTMFAAGLEYEHMMNNGFAWSLAGAYAEESTVNSRGWSEKDTYTVLSAGLKRYFGRRRAFYLAMYPQLAFVKTGDYQLDFLGVAFDPFGNPTGYEERHWEARGRGTLAMVQGNVGWRGVRGHFTFGGELGLVVNSSSFELEGITTEDIDGAVREWREKRKVDVFGNILSSAQFYLGYRF